MSDRAPGDRTAPADPPPLPEAEPVTLDCRGQRCPLPVIRLGALLRQEPGGTLVRLLATDPAARSDVPAFCRMRGHDLLVVSDEAGHTAYLVRGVSGTPAGPAPAALR